MGDGTGERKRTSKPEIDIRRSPSITEKMKGSDLAEMNHYRPIK